jgi:glycosyltransferase involved in cell wall biosynthesis
MRVLHVTECYSAGTGAVVNQLAEGLPGAEHHLLWHADSDPCTPAAFESIEQLPAGAGARIRSVAARAARIRPDVIHAHSSWAGIYARLARAGTPVVYQPHCFGFVNPSVGRSQRVLARITEQVLAHRTAAVVAVSPYEERLARRVSRLARTHVAMVPNRAGITERRPRPYRTEHPVVAMIGRLSPQKDPEFFAEVSAKVRARRPDVRFRWIGGGTDERYLRLLAAAKVEVTGWLSTGEMAKALDGSDLYLHSAASEGFPISVLDAAAAGLPVVVRDIDAFAGLSLVKAGDVDEAARRLEQVLGEPAHRAHALMGTADLLAAMNETRQAEALAAVYHQVIGER